MKYILFVFITQTHWFSDNTHTFITQEFNTKQACESTKIGLNTEFHIIDKNMNAECVFKGEK